MFKENKPPCVGNLRLKEDSFFINRYVYSFFPPSLELAIFVQPKQLLNHSKNLNLPLKLFTWIL